VEDILAGKIDLDQSVQNLSLTVLFIDICGYTKLSEAYGPAKMARILNLFLDKMVKVVFENGGTIDKFMGDAIMAIFGAPHKLSVEQQAQKAVTCARAMQSSLKQLNKELKQENIELNIRIGIDQGPVQVGNFGNDQRSDYTAVGPTVNMAARIETACQPGEIYISKLIRDYLPENSWESVGNLKLKGIENKIPIFKLV